MRMSYPRTPAQVTHSARSKAVSGLTGTNPRTPVPSAYSAVSSRPQGRMGRNEQLLPYDARNYSLAEKPQTRARAWHLFFFPSQLSQGGEGGGDCG